MKRNRIIFNFFRTYLKIKSKNVEENSTQHIYYLIENKVNFNLKRDLCIQETISETRTYEKKREQYSVLTQTVNTTGVKRREKLSGVEPG